MHLLICWIGYLPTIPVGVLLGWGCCDYCTSDSWTFEAGLAVFLSRLLSLSKSKMHFVHTCAVIICCSLGEVWYPTSIWEYSSNALSIRELLITCWKAGFFFFFFFAGSSSAFADLQLNAGYFCSVLLPAGSIPPRSPISMTALLQYISWIWLWSHVGDSYALLLIIQLH